jgi:hypothetical protein
MLTGRLPFVYKNSNKQDFKSLFHRILNDEPLIPNELSENSKQILLQLLEKQSAKRLGSSTGDYEDVKKHSFFNQIDWSKLLNKEIEPPFRPLIVSETDTSYFEEEFTTQSIQLTPPVSESKKSFDFSMLNSIFDSYSYYGSKSSLDSNWSSQASSTNYNCQAILTNFETRSMMNQSLNFVNQTNSKNNETTQIFSLRRHSQYNHIKSLENLDSHHSNQSMLTKFNINCSVFDKNFEKSSMLLASNAFPNFIQMNDNFTVKEKIENEDLNEDSNNLFSQISSDNLSIKSSISFISSSSSSSSSSFINSLNCKSHHKSNTMLIESSSNYFRTNLPMSSFREISSSNELIACKFLDHEDIIMKDLS